MSPSLLARVFIVRHGETAWNKDNRMQGWLDIPLNDLGISQARLTAEALKDTPLDRAFTSDLQRASKTAEIILEHHPGVRLEKHQWLRERFLAELQGQIAPVRNRNPSGMIETSKAVAERSTKGWEQYIVEYIKSCSANSSVDGRCRYILVTSHGGLISRLVRKLLLTKAVRWHPGPESGEAPQMPDRVANASISIVDFTLEQLESGESSIQGTLVQYSDTKHLAGTVVHETNADMAAPA